MFFAPGVLSDSRSLRKDVWSGGVVLEEDNTKVIIFASGVAYLLKVTDLGKGLYANYKYHRI